MRAALLAALPVLMAACVVVPRDHHSYDAQCQREVRRMTLDVKQVGEFGNCANGGCVGLLVMYGAIAATSAAVSGSIVVTGNAVSWIEHRAACSPIGNVAQHNAATAADSR